MDTRVEVGKATIGGICMMLIQTIQNSETLKLLPLLLALMTFDFILGWAKSKKNGTWKSMIAKRGMLGKLFQFGFVTIAHLIGRALDFYAVEYWVIAYFCLVEIGSILENAYEFGVPIPKGFADLGSKGKYYVGYILVKKIENAIQGFTKMDFSEVDKIAQKEQEKEKEEKEKEQENKGENK